MPLDAREGLVRVVVGLLHQPKLLALLLVEPHRDRVLLLEALERKDEELCVVLVRQRREGDGAELAALEPMHSGCVDRHRLLRGHIRPVLQEVVLPLLLSLQPQASEAAEVLPADGLVNSRPAPDALTVVVRHVRPPVGLLLDVAQDHVLHRRRQPWDLPRDVCLPAAPRLAEVLEDGPRFVLLDALWHHVQDVVHDRGAELEIKVALDALLGHGLGHAL
mmetsp:Transcript_21771/g.52021  ORF Transcript_21771/g.52021 Transcript_21771/m.52021 type:complete len:220 (-) Transcript_21771:2237-2896(-)